MIAVVAASSLGAPHLSMGFSAGFGIAAAGALAAAIGAGLLIPAGKPAAGAARFMH